MQIMVLPGRAARKGWTGEQYQGAAAAACYSAAVVVTAHLACACGECRTTIPVAYNGLGLVTVSDPGWIIRTVQRGERQVEIRVWRLECVRAERPATGRAVTRPVR